jgi:hypothetical protein
MMSEFGKRPTRQSAAHAGNYRRTLGVRLLPEDSDGIMQSTDVDKLPIVGGLRLVALNEPDLPQRRRAPRRRDISAFLVERRRSDRRRSKPGLDGLLRTVLADDWM